MHICVFMLIFLNSFISVFFYTEKEKKYAYKKNIAIKYSGKKLQYFYGPISYLAILTLCSLNYPYS